MANLERENAPWIICRPDGLADFELVHSRENDDRVSLCAFDLLEFNGCDYRVRPLNERKGMLADLLINLKDGIEFNPRVAGDGPLVFEDACSSTAKALSPSGLIAVPIRQVKAVAEDQNPESPAARSAEDGTF